ncbi:hypothetical protein BY458DRAFT_553330 [Sporodiniella umbellata]|nr:hypothetical protein BY458DRAFT_553330 [Sporodiniella umbellata]
MFPSTGLFKSTICPFYPKCSKEPCFFSHDGSSLAGSYLRDRPEQTTSKRPLPQPNPVLQEESERLKKRRQPLPLTNITTVPLNSFKENRGDPSQSNAVSVRKALPHKTLQSPSSLEPIKRAAHTSKPETHSAKPPTILPNIKSKIPIMSRQMLANKLYESFRRIYAPILSQKPTAASESTTKQEEFILNNTTNVAGYKQMAATVLGNLKKRPISVSLDDIGIDGEWKDPELDKNDFVFADTARQCVASTENLKEMGYPLPNLLSDVTVSFGACVGNQITCDRCKSPYILKDLLDNQDAEACLYHSQRMTTVLINGEKKRIYSCCQDAQESNGCTRGPHVYKEVDLGILHAKIPFVEAPPYSKNNKDRRRIIALDCEMGYTTAGMELIRLTIVDDKKVKLLDELVLPSHMVVDLNTRYSGVKTLEGVKHDLRSLRKEIFKYIDRETIVLGHGLENDMCALRLIHTNVIDTVHLFPHRMGLPYRNSLRTLSSTFAQKLIQQGSDGHDSMEDAATCIDLLKVYIKKNKIRY